MWAAFVQDQSRSQQRRGFTIVELLIVIVVIGILAAITIVAFNGVQNKAKASAAQSAVTQASKKIIAYAVQNADQYPVDLATADVTNAQGLEYSYDNSVSPRTYGVTATNGMYSYYLSNTTTQPTAGGYAGHSAYGVAVITNMMPNPSAETNTTSIAGAGAGVALARDASQAFAGSAAIKAVADGTASGSGVQYLTAGGPYAASTYKAAVYVKGTAGVQVYGVLRATNSGVSDIISAPLTLTGAWQRIDLAAMTIPGSATTQFSLMVRTYTTVATTFWTDAAMLTDGSAAYVYADGNTAGWAWNGTVNNSTSKGVPQ